MDPNASGSIASTYNEGKKMSASWRQLKLRGSVSAEKHADEMGRL